MDVGTVLRTWGKQRLSVEDTVLMILICEFLNNTAVPVGRSRTKVGGAARRWEELREGGGLGKPI